MFGLECSAGPPTHGFSRQFLLTQETKDKVPHLGSLRQNVINIFCSFEVSRANGSSKSPTPSSNSGGQSQSGLVANVQGWTEKSLFP